MESPRAQSSADEICAPSAESWSQELPRRDFVGRQLAGAPNAQGASKLAGLRPIKSIAA